MSPELFAWCMEKPFWKRTDDELIAFVSTQEDNHVHRAFRVTAYVLLLARLGDARREMPYEVWTLVMGDLPPPCTFGAGMFPFIPDPNMFYQRH